MKLKALFFTLALILTANLTAKAQDGASYNADDCKKYRSLYYQYLKQDMFRDACTFWGMAITNCGDSLDGKFYKNGRVAYLKLKKTIDKENKERIQEIDDTLAWIYESRMKIEKDPAWELDYANMLVTNKSDDFAKIDELYKNIHVMKDKAKSSHIRMYFRHLILNKFNKAPQEEKDGERENVIEEYIVLSDYVGTALKNAEAMTDEKRKAKTIKSYKAAQDFLDKYFLKIAKDCEVLTPVLDKKFEKIPAGEEGLEEINKYIGLMEKQKCTDSDTYAKFVQESVDRNPTAAGFAGLGNVQLNRDQAKEAVESLKKAVEMEGEGENKDKYLYNLALAQYKAKSYKAAFGTAKKVQGDLRGKALKICGDCIAATANGCGDSSFARKANYWLANDYYRKAASAGAEVSSSKFLSNAPTAEDCFAEGVTMGSSYTLSCWGESTTVR